MGWDNLNYETCYYYFTFTTVKNKRVFYVQSETESSSVICFSIQMHIIKMLCVKKRWDTTAEM